jgi:hypothetical protein
MNQAALNDAPVGRIVTTWNPSRFQNTAIKCFSAAIVLRIIQGIVKRGDLQAISNVFKIKPTLVAGYNVMRLVVLLHLQGS